MNNSTNDPDLNLQSFNDHGIFTLEELNELSNVVPTTLKSRIFQNQYKKILSNYFRMLLLEWYPSIYTQSAN